MARKGEGATSEGKGKCKEMAEGGPLRCRLGDGNGKGREKGREKERARETVTTNQETGRRKVISTGA